MKNSEQPINPIDKLSNVLAYGIGLTKREYFAGLAMQSIAHLYAGMPNNDRKEIVAKLSIKYADELLKQLEE